MMPWRKNNNCILISVLMDDANAPTWRAKFSDALCRFNLKSVNYYFETFKYWVLETRPIVTFAVNSIASLS